MRRAMSIVRGKMFVHRLLGPNLWFGLLGRGVPVMSFIFLFSPIQ